MMCQICVLFLLLSFNASAQAQTSGPVTRLGYKHPMCPETSLQNQTAAELLATQQQLAINILSVEIPNISKLGKEYIRISKEMINGPNRFHSLTATFNSFSQAVNQFNLDQRPNGCAMASMINATVEFYKYNNKEPMLKALQLLNNQIGTNVDTIVAKSQIASGCCKPGAPTSLNQIRLSNESCFDNGYTYKFDEIWQMRGGNLPNEYKCVVSKMYKCGNFVDNYLALIATYALTPFREVTRTTSSSLSSPVELVSLQTVSVLPKCCCKDFLNRLDKLSEQTGGIISEVFTAEVAMFTESDVCCKKKYV